MRINWDLTPAVLARRYKRFLADTDQGLTLHCPNTGAMTGMQGEGWPIGYRPTQGTKTAGRWILVETDQGLACVDSALANSWADGVIQQCFAEYEWAREVRLADRRIDFCGSSDSQRFWLEVKGVTLCLGDGQGAFPDAKSLRATEQLKRLVEQVKDGDRAGILYMLMHNGIDRVQAAQSIDPVYTQTLASACEAGVEVWQCATRIDWQGVSIDLPVRVS